MEFGERPLARAKGAILAHSHRLASGRIRKGRRLDADDIAALEAEGIDRAIVAVPGPDDLDEDTAAAANNKAVTVGIKSAARALRRVVILAAHRAHSVKQAG